MKVALVGIAGAMGALARYGIGRALTVAVFPWTTLGINVVGSFALGAIVRAAAARGWPDTLTIALTVGFLGAFTTFSTFSIEAHDLLRNGRHGALALYVGASVVGGVLAALAGYEAARVVW